MFRIDHPTAVAALPSQEPAGPSGYFTKGNPTEGLPATRVSYDWLNAVQEEVCNAITGLGVPMELSKSDHTQLLTAIRGAFLLGINGYQKLPSGLLHQWGTIFPTLVSVGVATVTLPTVFPVEFYTVLVVDNASDVASVQSWSAHIGASLSSFTACCADHTGASISNSSARFFAIGK